jgi:hypothetical protein
MAIEDEQADTAAGASGSAHGGGLPARVPEEGDCFCFSNDGAAASAFVAAKSRPAPSCQAVASTPAGLGVARVTPARRRRCRRPTERHISASVYAALAQLCERLDPKRLGRVAATNRSCGPWTCGLDVGKIFGGTCIAVAANSVRAGSGLKSQRVGMSQLLRTATVIARMAIALMIVMFALGAAGATSAPLEKKDCNWGASSVTAWTDADGAVHQTAPMTTGCIP